MWIMYDNILVAEESKSSRGPIFVLQEDLPHFCRPIGLFVQGKTEVTLAELKAWLANRIFPKNRGDVKDLLKSLGLRKYDVLEIAKLTKASLIGDGFWLKVNESDSYEEHTLRGKLGKPETKLEDFK